MKRIQAFEFEDFSWFPSWVRDAMTRLILVMHRLLKTNKDLEKLVEETLKISGKEKVFDFCSGSGGLMPQVMDALNKKNNTSYSLELSDLFPNVKVAQSINARKDLFNYRIEKTDVTTFKKTTGSLRTMVCSFHHFNPSQTKRILQGAVNAKEPIIIYEMSDNSIPFAISWIALFTNFISCLFITPMVKGLTFKQVVFTYIIPIIPVFYAWDGAISNMRTYTPADLKLLLKEVNSENYTWKIEIIKEKTNRLALIGIPQE